MKVARTVLKRRCPVIIRASTLTTDGRSHYSDHAERACHKTQDPAIL